MKKISLLFFFAFLLFSCEKDFLIPDKEVPDWLKARIKQDEQIIKDSPQLMYSTGAWLRYKWENKYYFEYHNPLSSAGTEIFDYDGNKIIVISAPNLNYNSEKCCKEYVWKAPGYDELPGI